MTIIINIFALDCRYEKVGQSARGEIVSIERLAEMKIKWEENSRCWYGAPKTVFPQFEAWRSDESVEDLWCLSMVKSPNARPIRVRGLQSLKAAKEFARGLLAEFDYVPDRGAAVTVGGEAEQARVSRVAGVHS
ncbi:MAG: hypothetical protein ACYSWQ_11985 [Planctomycetota bacterium]